MGGDIGAFGDELAGEGSAGLLQHHRLHPLRDAVHALLRPLCRGGPARRAGFADTGRGRERRPAGARLPLRLLGVAGIGNRGIEVPGDRLELGGGERLAAQKQALVPLGAGGDAEKPVRQPQRPGDVLSGACGARRR